MLYRNGMIQSDLVSPQQRSSCFGHPRYGERAVADCLRQSDVPARSNMNVMTDASGTVVEALDYYPYGSARATCVSMEPYVSGTSPSAWEPTHTTCSRAGLVLFNLSYAASVIS